MRLLALLAHWGGRLAIGVVLLAMAPAAAQAATQTRSDPSDAPDGTAGKADLRSLTWDVSPTSATLTVGVDASTFGSAQPALIGIHVLVDVDGDGRADDEIVATRNAGGSKVDVALRSLDKTTSGPDCQDLAGKATSASDTVQPTVAGGIETFSFTFDPTLVPGSLAAFRWAVFAQAPPDASKGGPWDVMPAAADPDPAAANPGDRSCGANSVPLRMSAGVAFPEPAVQPTPTASPGPSKPVVVLSLPGGQPSAGGMVTIAANTTLAPGTHIVSHEWDVNGDHQVDINSGTNPVIHLPAGTAAHTVTSTVTDSNWNAGSASVLLSPSPPAQNCDAEASIRILRVRAECIRRVGDVTTASGGASDRTWGNFVIELNGLSLVTRDPHATVTFDEGANEIVGHGEFRVMSLNMPGGDITWWQSGPSGFTWPMPPRASATRGVPMMVSIAAGECTATVNEGALCAQLPGGFPVGGRIGVGIDLESHDAVLDVQASVESGIRVTTGVRLRTNLELGGIELDSIRFRVDNARFGVLTLDTLAFAYEPPGGGVPRHEGDLWDVAMGVSFSSPPFRVAGRMIFENGPLTFASAELLITPGIPIYAGVFLNHFAGHFGTGNVVRFGGLLGMQLITILQVDGFWNYAAFRNGITALSGGGRATLAGGELANFLMQFWSDGYFAFSGRLGYQYPTFEDPVFSLLGQTDFWVEAQPGTERARYQGDGDLRVKIGGFTLTSAHIFINNDWAAGCGFGLEGTHSYRTNEDHVFAALRCDLGPYSIQPTRPHEGILPASVSALAAQSAPQARALTVPRGETALVLEVAGDGGAPKLTLADPKGKLYTPAATVGKVVADGAFTSAYSPEGAVTLLRVDKPRAGTWVLTPEPGSPAIKKVTRATALPPLAVSARVSGSGRQRVLTWRAPGLAGRTIRFTERGKDVGRTIAVTKKARGRAAYTIQGGSAGRRTVEAQVTTGNGIPVGTPTVAHYTAPGPARPGRPGRVKVSRRGPSVKISWPKLKGADGYLVRVRGSDGRKELFFRTAKRRKVTTLRVAPWTKLKVTVAGWIGTNLRPGPVRKAALKAVKTKRPAKKKAKKKKTAAG
jgi:hypothetical protein